MNEPAVNEPTEDTPQEREEKAEILRDEREDLLHSIRRFRWEVRLYWVAVGVILFLNTN